MDENKNKIPDFPEMDDQYVDVLPESNVHGPILQAFNWTFNDVTKNLSAIKNAGFKIVQISPVQPPKNGGTTWWSYYQPLGFVIAEQTPLGTKEDLANLCEEANKQGIDIIADIVLNHLANTTDTAKEADGTPVVHPSVELYEPIIYKNRNEDTDGNGITFHHGAPGAGSGSETQVYPYGNLPDLDTSNPHVQERCLQFLKDCIDIGLDGFRIDTAKHIETPDDTSFASDFWTNTLVVAKQYYSTLNNKDLYVYGEILGDPIGRDISVYTKLMNVSEDNYNSKVRTALTNKNYSALLADNPYGKKVADNSSLVVWDESHDDVIDATNKLSPNAPVDLTKIQKYAIIASNKDITPMFLARPTKDVDVGTVGNYLYESEEIAAINRFGNRYKNATQYLSDGNNMFVNEKIVSDTNQGALIVAKGNSNKTAEAILPHFNDGAYFDQNTGKKVIVYNHKATIEFNQRAIAILTKTKNCLRPTITSSSRGETFVGSLKVDLSTANTTSASYKINDGEETSFTNSTSLTLTEDNLKDGEIVLHVKASNDHFTIERSYVFNIVYLVEGYFNVLNFDASILDNKELYEWAWSSNASGKWIQIHTYQDGRLLLDFSGTPYTSFLLAQFPKNYVITNLNAWDEKCEKQTTDIQISKEFFDAKGF